MLKSSWLFPALLAAMVQASLGQNLTGRPGNPVARTYSLSAQILHEGSFQLQRSGPGLSNWISHATFNAHPGTNGFTDTITNLQSFYRLVRFTNAPTITNQPVGITNFYNQPVQLEVGYIGSWPLRFYWYKDDQVVGAATTNIHAFAGRTNLSGNYFVVVSNSWGTAQSTSVSVKTINPVATTVRDKKIQYVIKGAQSGFVNSGSFETTYGQFGYATTSSNFGLNDQGQWQYGVLSETVGRVLWTGGFVYSNGAYVDMTFTNLTAGTFNLRLPGNDAIRQFGDFRFTN
jgi:hypothetical protein